MILADAGQSSTRRSRCREKIGFKSFLHTVKKCEPHRAAGTIARAHKFIGGRSTRKFREHIAQKYLFAGFPRYAVIVVTLVSSSTKGRAASHLVSRSLVDRDLAIRAGPAPAKFVAVSNAAAALRVASCGALRHKENWKRSVMRHVWNVC